jgi:hypothetical protein
VDSDCAQALVGARVNIGGRERHPRGPGLVPHGLATDPHESWLSALAWNVAGILLFGLLVAAFTSNSHRAYAYALAGLDPAQRAAAVDASFRGPVPVDAPVRDAAIRVAGRRLQSARFWRVLWLVLLCLIILSAGRDWCRALGHLLGKLTTGLILPSSSSLRWQPGTHR